MIFRPVEDILKDFPNKGHVVIEASAGTGKTFSIENIAMLALLKQKIPLEKILIVTFTKLATEELKTRIHDRLKSFLHLSDRDLEHWAELARCSVRSFRNKVSSLLVGFESRAQIFTIHGFCEHLLNSPDWSSLYPKQVLDESNFYFEQATEAFVRDVLGREYSDLLLQLTKSYALSSIKTVLQGSYAKNLPFYPPKQTISMALKHFEAWKEIVQHFDLQEWILVYKQDVHKLYKKSLEKIVKNLEKIDEILSRNEQSLDQFLEMQALDLSVLIHPKLRKGSPFPQSLPKEMWACIQEMQSWIESPINRENLLLRKIFERYRAFMALHKKKWRWKHYRDLLDRTLVVLNRYPKHLEAVRNAYTWAIVDEFHDTNDVQWEIFAKIFVHARDEHRMIVVGDPKQAIYGFRGGDIFTYRRAVNVLQRDRALLQLVHNYRSTPKMVNAFNLFFDANTQKPFLNGHNSYTAVQSARQSWKWIDGMDESQEIPPMTFVSMDCKTPKVLSMLIKYYASEIQAILRGSQKWKGRVLDESKPPTILVLVETNQLGLEVAQIFRTQGIDYRLEEAESGLQAWSTEIREVIDLLEGIENPHDQGAAVRAWLTPFFDMPYAQVASIPQLSDDHPFKVQLEDWHEWAEKGDFIALFQSILTQSRLEPRLIFMDDRRWNRYQSIFEVLMTEVGTEQSSLWEYRSYLQDLLDGALPYPPWSSIDQDERNTDKVEIMTLHKSKGLEADVVFLVLKPSASSHSGLFRTFHDDQGNAWLLFPAKKGALSQALSERAEREEIEEKQRLIYVGMTRAKAKLYVPYCTTQSKKVQNPITLITQRIKNLRLEDYPELLERKNLETQESEEIQSDLKAERRAKIAMWTPEIPVIKAEPWPSWIQDILQRPYPYHGSFTQLRRFQSASEEAEGYYLEEEVYEHLPPGRSTGLYLHKILEKISYAQVLNAEDFEAWKAESQVFFEKYAEVEDFPKEYIGLAQHLIYRVLRRPVQSSLKIPNPLGLLEGFREFNFAFSYLGKRETHFIHGIIDLFAIWENRYYLLDWKSTLLKNYKPETLAKHVHKMHYELQANIYIHAANRHFNIKDERDYEQRFGGFIFAFLRGFVEDAPDHGIYLYRPSWSALILSKDSWHPWL